MTDIFGNSINFITDRKYLHLLPATFSHNWITVFKIPNTVQFDRFHQIISNCLYFLWFTIGAAKTYSIATRLQTS